MGYKENLNNQRERFRKVFNDTLDFIKSNELLSSLTESSVNNTHIYLTHPCNDNPSVEGEFYFTNVFITKNKTIDAALRLHEDYPARKIAVLNFASATNPGGGVLKGASAQEESICRCTTLYPCLNKAECYRDFYIPHRNAKDPLHNDDIIYSPDVIICKTDDGNFSRLPDDEFVKIDVITCAAPNLRENPQNDFNQEGTNSAVNISDEDLYKLHLKRARAILNIAVANDVEILVLGAFGCGAFRNNPKIVAKAYKDALKGYWNRFQEIEFAIFCRQFDSDNYDAFAEEFKQYD